MVNERLINERNGTGNGIVPESENGGLRREAESGLGAGRATPAGCRVGVQKRHTTSVSHFHTS